MEAVDFSGLSKASTRFQEVYENHTENFSSNLLLHQSSILVEKEQYKSLQGVLTTLSGISISKIFFEDVNLFIECKIKKCDVCLELNTNKKLVSLEIRGDKFQWMNSKLILAECQAYDSPNDLRHAVFMISSVQECRTLLQKHAAEFRKVCIVQYFAPLRVKFTYKNGMTVMIQASESYPQVPGCVQVVDVDYFSLTLDEDIARKLKNDANNKCFRLLSEIYYFFDEYKDA